MTTPPDDLPRYRPLTGSDEGAFSRHVSAALDLGHEPYGSPCVTSDGERVIFAQAVLRPGKTAAAKAVPGITADSILVPRDRDAADDIGPRPRGHDRAPHRVRADHATGCEAEGGRMFGASSPDAAGRSGRGATPLPPDAAGFCPVGLHGP